MNPTSSPLLQLSPDTRAYLIGLFQQVVPRAEVWAYGSRVAGAGHDGSDLDLVVRLLPERVPSAVMAVMAVMAVLREQIKTSDLPILVDVHDWATLPASFQSEITRRHTVLV